MTDDARFRDAAVLITGGLGFIGSRLASRLVTAGARVTILDSMAANSGANDFNIAQIRDRVTVIAGDVCDNERVRACLEGQQFLFNLAGQVSHMESMRDPLHDLDVNYRAQIGLLDAVISVNPDIRIVHAGTRQVYGRPRYLPVDEAHPLDPPDANAINKLAGEMYHTLCARVFGTRSTILRMTNVYGPHMRVKDARQTFIGVWLAAVVQDRQFAVWGGEQRRDFTFVDDLADVCCRVALRDDTVGETYNVGGGPPVSLLDLAELLVEVAGAGSYEIHEFPAERRAIDIGDYHADDRKLRAATGWAPATSLRDGLAQSVAFYRRHGEHYA